MAVLGLSSGWAMTWVLMTEESMIASSDLIAIVDVGKVHEATTPEGFRLWSAKVKVEEIAFLRCPLIPGDQPVVIYSLDVNAAVSEENVIVDGAQLPIFQGRALICMKQRGMNKFYPSEPLHFQLIESDGTVRWPFRKPQQGEENYQRVPVQEVVHRVREMLGKFPGSEE